ncbi:hypothetical protein PUNSTDRAFT_17540, partial [Punctularia strigosozonata HHB-11173 SS5]
IWDGAMQARFESRIARITASAGLPLSWVDNLEFKAFVEDFIPAARLFSRRTLTSRILPAEVAVNRRSCVSRVKDGECTIAYDAWTGNNQQNLLPFQGHAKGEIFTISVHDISGERKFAINLLPLIEQAYEDAQNIYGVNVVAIVSDAGGDARAAPQMFGRKHPRLVIPDCYAHQ